MSFELSLCPSKAAVKSVGASVPWLVSHQLRQSHQLQFPSNGDAFTSVPSY